MEYAPNGSGAFTLDSSQGDDRAYMKYDKSMGCITQRSGIRMMSGRFIETRVDEGRSDLWQAVIKEKDIVCFDGYKANR